MGLAAFQVHITPLFRGVPGQDEYFSSGRSEINEEDLIPVPQFGDLEVKTVLNEGREAKVKISMYEPVIAGLKPFQFAIRIGFKRPLETQYEIIFWGQSNISKRFKEGYVELNAHDPIALKSKYHQVRRGDWALNVDNERGRITSDYIGMDTILQAAHNIPSQQNRRVPCFAFPTNQWGLFTEIEDPPLIGYERFTPVWSLCEQILKSVYGPDMDCLPSWLLPANCYGTIDCYDRITDHTDPTPDSELGRYLVPDDPDDLNPGEVIFNYGTGEGVLDNCEDVEEDPERPATHAHYYDSYRVYRETRADLDSSYLVGVWVDAVDAGFDIKRPGNGETVDTRPLEYLAEQHVKSYGVPPEHFTVTHRPVDVQPFQYGHPRWPVEMTGFVVGGDWYLGDFVLVRAERGYASFMVEAKIVGVTIKQKDGKFNGLPYVETQMIPAVGGTSGTNVDDDPDSTLPVVTFDIPLDFDTVSGDVTITAVAVSDDVSTVEFSVDDVTVPGGLVILPPYTVVWDSTLVGNGTYTLKALATDTSANTGFVTITITVAN